MRGRRGSRSGRGQDCSKVIFEDKSISIFVCFLSTCTSVSRAEITIGVILWQMRRLGWFYLTKPWSFCAMGRNENMLVCKRVYCPMMSVIEFDGI